MINRRSITTCLVMGATMAVPSCRIVNGQIDYSWVGEQFSPPVEDSVYIDRGTGALDIPAAQPMKPALAATPQPTLPPPAAPAPQQQKDGFFSRLFSQNTDEPAQSAQYITYTVVAGDTLSGIARRHGTRTGTLIQINKLDTTRPLQINQKLSIPVSGATRAPQHSAASAPAKKAPQQNKQGFFSRIFAQNNASSPAPGTGKLHYITYTVVAGDTLSGIARRHGTTARTLIDINKIDTTRPLQINQKLQIPSKLPPAPAKQRPQVTPPAASPTPAEPTAPVAEAPTGNYTVQPGDTLYGISRKLNITPDALMQANGFTPETAGQIRAGASLKLPTSSTASTSSPQP